jgi:hypothetical protein
MRFEDLKTSRDFQELDVDEIRRVGNERVLKAYRALCRLEKEAEDRKFPTEGPITSIEQVKRMTPSQVADRRDEILAFWAKYRKENRGRG